MDRSIRLVDNVGALSRCTGHSVTDSISLGRGGAVGGAAWRRPEQRDRAAWVCGTAARSSAAGWRTTGLPTDASSHGQRGTSATSLPDPLPLRLYSGVNDEIW